jgi:hypothetical protein
VSCANHWISGRKRLTSPSATKRVTSNRQRGYHYVTSSNTLAVGSVAGHTFAVLLGHIGIAVQQDCCHADAAVDQTTVLAAEVEPLTADQTKKGAVVVDQA